MCLEMLNKVVLLLGSNFLRILTITSIISIFTIILDTFTLALILGYLGESFGYETSISMKLVDIFGSTLISSELFILSIFILRGAGTLLTGLWNAKCYAYTVATARLNSLNFLLNSEYSNFIKQDAATTTQAFTTLPLQLGSVVRGGIDLVTGIVFLLSLVVLIIIDFGVSATLGICGLVVITIPLILMMKKNLLSAGKVAMESENIFISLVNFTLSSFRFIRSSRSTDDVSLAVSASIQQWQDNTKKAMFVASAPRVFIETLFILAILFLGLSEIGVSFVVNHIAVLTIVFVRAIPALSTISGALQNLQFHWSQSLKLISLQYEWASKRVKQPMATEFNGVQIAVPIITKEPTMKFAGFTLNVGDKKVIYGPSGSGKSLFLDCIAGFREIEGGSYHVGECKTDKHETVLAWGDLVYCAQDEKLFEGTIRENIFFGTIGADNNPNKKTIE
jgi:ABC-type multidrug transport system fused ATPase/permease subunit